MLRISIIAVTLSLLSFQKSNAYNEDLIDSGKLLYDAYQVLQDGDTVKALEMMKLVHPNDTNYNIALLQQINVYNALEEWNKSLDLANEGLKVPTTLEYRFFIYKGNVLVELEKYDDALKVYEKGLQKYPYNHYLTYYMALAYKEKGDFDAYFEALKRTVDIYPFYANVHYELGHLASKGNRISQSLMSYIMGILLEPNSERSKSALIVMNNMVTDKIEEKKDDEEDKGTYEFPEGVDDYSEIDNIIKNYVAFQPEYKVKSKADLKLIRQFQVMMETLDYDAGDKGFWMQFYVNFYKKLWKEKQFESFSYYILRPSDVPEYVKLVNKKQKNISQFSLWAGTAIKEYFSEIPMEVEGEMIKLPRSYHGGDRPGMASLGKMENGVRKGCWYFIHTTGTLEGKGCYNNYGQQDGEWVWYNRFGQIVKKYNASKTSFDGVYELYSDIGTLVLELNFKDGKRQGVSKNYFDLGGIARETTFKDDVTNGPAKIYHENGVVKYKYSNKNGKLHGLLKEYYENGQLKAVAKYVDGEIDSVSTNYHPNGQLYSKYEYKKGVLDGPYEKYWMDGTPHNEGKYKNDNQLGEQKQYFQNGNISKVQVYDTEGKENGVSILYDEDGIKYQELDFKKGNIVAYRIYNKKGEVVKQDTKKGGEFKYHSLHPDGAEGAIGIYDSKGGKEGEWKYHDQNGVLSEIAHYKENLLQGERLRYFANGNLKSKANFENDKWEGVYEVYYSHGGLSEEGYATDDNTTGPYYEYNILGDTSDVDFYVEGDREGWQISYAANKRIERITRYQGGDITLEYMLDSNGVKYDSLSYIGLTGKGSMNYPNGKLYYEGEYKNGIRNGKATWYFGNGKVWQEVNYINGTKDGTYKQYHPNGQLYAQYDYVFGYLNGKVLYYHENGQKQDEYAYNYGTRTGESIDYSESGVVTGKMTYELGDLHGKRFFYDPNGVLDHIRFYHYGKIIGYSYLGKDGKEIPMKPLENENGKVTSYFQNGKVSREYQMVNGNFDGLYIEYYASGNKSEELTYKKGDREGEWTNYYDNGKLRIKATYVHDQLHGSYVMYHSNGKIKEKGNYLIGDKHGDWTTYDKNGKVIKKEHYYLDLQYTEEKL